MADIIAKVGKQLQPSIIISPLLLFPSVSMTSVLNPLSTLHALWKWKSAASSHCLSITLFFHLFFFLLSTLLTAVQVWNYNLPTILCPMSTFAAKKESNDSLMFTPAEHTKFDAKQCLYRGAFMHAKGHNPYRFYCSSFLYRFFSLRCVRVCVILCARAPKYVWVR